MRQNLLSLILVMLSGILLSACTYDDIVIDNQEHLDVQKMQYIKSSYEKAYSKMCVLYPSTFATGKRMTTGSAPTIENSYPLWYSDTAIFIPNPDPNAPNQPGDDDEATAAKDSIYAYVFDFAGNQGSMVVSVDDNLPDLLVYTKGRNFMTDPFKRYTTKPTDNDWAYLLKFAEWELNSYIRREALIREILASLANATAGETVELKTYVEKVYAAEEGADGWHAPYVTSREITRDWYISQDFQHTPDGMVPVQWLDVLPFTSMIQRVYGTNANCWDIIPTVAMYFATLQPEVRSNDGWVMDWEAILNSESDVDSAYNMNNIARLYFELGLPENLNVQYYQDQTMEVKNRLPIVMSNYGLPVPSFYESLDPVWSIIDEIDNGRPAIGLIKGLRGYSNRNAVLSFLADDYQIRKREELDCYPDGVKVQRSYEEYFVNLTFSHFDSDNILPSVYFNLALFDPNLSRNIQMLRNTRSLLPIPKAKRLYDELNVPVVLE